MTAPTNLTRAIEAWRALTKPERDEVVSALRIARRQGKGYPAALAIIRAAERAAAEPEAPESHMVQAARIADSLPVDEEHERLVDDLLRRARARRFVRRVLAEPCTHAKWHDTHHAGRLCDDCGEELTPCP